MVGRPKPHGDGGEVAPTPARLTAEAAAAAAAAGRLQQGFGGLDTLCQRTCVEVIRHGSGHGIHVEMSNLSSDATYLRRGRERYRYVKRNGVSSRSKKRKRVSCRSERGRCNNE
ncbi:hypothetical protein Sjap_014802 [Stephania japonica]|uniref:Uncharacterized protein n=1 Tax=Stephania japonica TaxID=461633 RepID=A0AAP0NS95_9MAGN